MQEILQAGQSAYDHIRNRLLLGVYGPGEQISENSLAKEIGVSRTPVREAINRLESERLVRKIPNVGTFISCPTEQDLEDLYDIREMLEGYATKRAASRIQDSQLEQLADCCEVLRQCAIFVRENGGEDSPEMLQKMVEADLTFHSIIWAVSENPHVVKVISDLRILSHSLFVHRHEKKATLTGHARTWLTHMRILRALQRHDIRKSAELMSSHIQAAKRAAIATLRKLRQTGSSSDAWPFSVENLINRIIKN